MLKKWLLIASRSTAKGDELAREKLKPGGGMVRIAPSNRPEFGQHQAPRSAAAARPVSPQRSLPVRRPSTEYRPNDWNQVEILIDENMVHTFFNDGGDSSGITEDGDGSYGPLALYVEGTGEARFKDVAFRNLGLRETAVERLSPNFRMQRLSSFYYAWGAAASDFNHDGNLDIVAGPYIYLGPDYTQEN